MLAFNTKPRSEQPLVIKGFQEEFSISSPGLQNCSIMTIILCRFIQFAQLICFKSLILVQ
jgi:hypothetical protein